MSDSTGNGSGVRDGRPGEVQETPAAIPSSRVGILFTVLLWIVGGAALWGFTWGKPILLQVWWYPYAFVGVLVVILGSPFGWQAGRDYLKANATRQGLVLTFVVVPIVLGAVMMFRLFSPSGQFVLIRIAFVAVVCVFPAALYYLFIVTRKGSLFNEFMANMGRLGLLTPWIIQGPDGENRREPEVDRLRRVESYLQKFEAVFGPIPDDVRKTVASARDPSSVKMAAGRATVTDVFVSEAAVPVMLASFLCAVLWLVTLPPLSLSTADSLFELSAAIYDAGPPVDHELTPWWYSLRPTLTPITAAFLGAYFFSVQLLFRRYVRRDLRPGAYMGAVLRIILSIVSVWILQIAAPWVLSDVADSSLVALGFIVGVFPRIFFQILEGLAKKLVPTAVLPSLQSELPISDLDGLTVWHQARLEDEDIENVPNMATADLLELMINTRLSPDRLVDWVDQAMLYTALGPQPLSGVDARKALRSHGIRTSTALTEAYRRATQLDQQATQFESILPTTPRSQLKSLVDALDTMPNVRLARMWRGLPSLSFRGGDMPSAPSTTVATMVAAPAA